MNEWTNRYFWNVFPMLGTVLGARDRAENKIPCSFHVPVARSPKPNTLR